MLPFLHLFYDSSLSDLRLLGLGVACWSWVDRNATVTSNEMMIDWKHICHQKLRYWRVPTCLKPIIGFQAKPEQ